jgi:hypothetical protein
MNIEASKGTKMHNLTSQQIIIIDSSLAEQFENANEKSSEKFWAACPILEKQARWIAGSLFKKGVFAKDYNDVAQEACLLALSNPDLTATNIIAIIQQSHKPGHSKNSSAICIASINVDLDADDTVAMQFAALELEELAIYDWQAIEVAQIDIDTLRARIMKESGVGDRRARQIIAAGVEKIESQNQKDLFGFEFE